MTVSGVPTPGTHSWPGARAIRDKWTRRKPHPDAADPFPLDIDSAHEPHASHPSPEHASNVAARRASIGVVALEWGIRLALFAALAAIIYYAWTGNWFGAMTDAVGSWYGEEIVPWIAIDLDSVVVPGDSAPAGSVATDSVGAVPGR